MCEWDLDKAIPCEDNVQLVTKAIRQGADVNARIKGNKWPPLIQAIDKEEFKIVKILTRNGANVNLPGTDGRTPLIYSILKENCTIGKYLIKKGANTCKPDQNGKTPLSWAISKENQTMINCLLKNGATYTIQTALLEAIEVENLKIVKILVKKGASVNFVYENGITPLLKAIPSKNPKIAEFLIKNKADINDAGGTNMSPIIKAIETNSHQIFKILMKNKPNLALGPNGPFVKSVRKENFEMVKILVEHRLRNPKQDPFETVEIQGVPTDPETDVETAQVAQNCDQPEAPEQSQENVESEDKSRDLNQNPSEIANTNPETAQVEDRQPEAPEKSATVEARPTSPESDLEISKTCPETSGKQEDKISEMVENQVEASEKAGENIEMAEISNANKKPEKRNRKYVDIEFYCNQTDQDGRTALEIALLNSDFRTFFFLLDKGAVPTPQTREKIEVVKKNNMNFERACQNRRDQNTTSVIQRLRRLSCNS